MKIRYKRELLQELPDARIVEFLARRIDPLTNRMPF